LGVKSTKRILDVTSWLEYEACAYLYLQAFGQPRIRMCRTPLYMWQKDWASGCGAWLGHLYAL
jgi:hypothetical protein